MDVSSHGRRGVGGQLDEASALVNQTILPVKCRLAQGAGGRECSLNFGETVGVLG